MIKPDKQVFESLINLKLTPDFKVFMGWLDETIKESDAVVPFIQDEVKLRWMQGSLQTLRAMRKNIQNAELEYKEILAMKARDRKT